jgi:signal transduction histidine kinase
MAGVHDDSGRLASRVAAAGDRSVEVLGDLAHAFETTARLVDGHAASRTYHLDAAARELEVARAKQAWDYAQRARTSARAVPPRRFDAEQIPAEALLDRGHGLARQPEAIDARAERLLAVAQERRRIERDLHDGAQQRLVALRIGLALAQEMAPLDPAGCAARLDELGRQLEEALDELRSLAHGLSPPLLTECGLPDALAAAATRCTVPVELHATLERRYPLEVETSVYFCVLEALQNVAKHAHGARSVRIELDGHEPERLRFTVRDDGAGATHEALQRGAGITNKHDRIQALGGELQVTSTPGSGTLVRADIPLPASHTH